MPPSLPVDGALRLALAREALARGDLTTARRQISALRFSPDRLALQAQLALRDGDWETALRDALASEDLTTIDGLTSALLATGDVGQALAVQKAAVAKLVADPTQGEALAEAEFRLGQLEERTAWDLYVGTRLRRKHESAALAAYARASTLAPFAVRYLVAFGTQAINVDRYAAALAAFGRARAVDPTSAEPEVGLAELALRRGDRTAARVALGRAQALAPRSPAVRRLAHVLAQ
ncbi:MAG: tetratricopeptide repeat protein [Candidatus Eremiobacteraeota bacterium]|nr:tetratricopeptide repeat protein [Candidatus Eremiobacteraeota bacterium]